MANIPGITGSINPDVFGGEVQLESDLGTLKFSNSTRSLMFRYLYIYSPDKVKLADAGMWAYVDFSTGKYDSVAMRKLLDAYPEQKIELLKIAVRNKLDVWYEQDEETKTIVMTEILGKHE